MDVSKAFDTMGINAMLLSCIIIKVFVVKPSDSLEIGIMTWRVCVHRRKSSRTYMIQQATRQGGVLSPWLFLVFIDDLIEDLQSLDAGVSLHAVYLGSPMFADDFTMLSRTKSGLDKLLQTSWEYTLTLRKL